VSVQTELIGSLMAKQSQKPDCASSILQIHQMTAEKANAQLAGVADSFPTSASFFASLLNQWKSEPGIK
jgi:hypothetical protein